MSCPYTRSPVGPLRGPTPRCAEEGGVRLRRGHVFVASALGDVQSLSLATRRGI